jgi:hypothetical protein
MPATVSFDPDTSPVELPAPTVEPVGKKCQATGRGLIRKTRSEDVRVVGLPGASCVLAIGEKQGVSEPLRRRAGRAGWPGIEILLGHVR